MAVSEETYRTEGVVPPVALVVPGVAIDLAARFA